MSVTDQLGPNHTRTGSADHGEYYTKEDKVILTGGSPQIIDSIRGVTKGKDITSSAAKIACSSKAICRSPPSAA